MDKSYLSLMADKFNARARAGGWAACCDPQAAYAQPELSALKDTWFRTAGEKRIPARLQLTPRVIGFCLPHVSLYERACDADGATRYRLRVQGAAARSLFGEICGSFVDETFPEDECPFWHDMLDTVLAYGWPMRFVLRCEADGVGALTGEYLLAPLGDADGEPNLVLAAGYHSDSDWNAVAKEMAAA